MFSFKSAVNQPGNKRALWTYYLLFNSFFCFFFVNLRVLGLPPSLLVLNVSSVFYLAGFQFLISFFFTEVLLLVGCIVSFLHCKLCANSPGPNTPKMGKNIQCRFPEHNQTSIKESDAFYSGLGISLLSFVLYEPVVLVFPICNQ